MSFWNGLIPRAWAAPPPPSMLPAPSSSSFNTAADRHLAVPPWEAYHHAGPSSASSSRSSFDSRGAAPAFLSLPSTPTDSSFYNEPASSRMATEILGDYDEDEADFDDDDDSAMEDDVVPADHPSRFEQRSTPDGQVFYVDHHLKITSWELHKPRRQTLRRKVKYVREQVLARVRADVRPGARDRVCLLRVRRDDMFESSFEAIARKTPEELQRKLAVEFAGEEGIDAGGLSREFFHLISSHISNPAYGLFHAPSSEHPDLLSINPLSSINPAHLDYFRVVGRLIGLALLNGEKVSVGFAGIVWKLLVGGLERAEQPTEGSVAAGGSSSNSSSGSGGGGGRRRRRSDEDEGHRLDGAGSRGGKRRRRAIVGVEDLKGVDDALGKSLEWVRANDPSVLCRSFTYDVDQFGTPTSIPLRPNGASIDVTEANKEDYVQEMARFVLLENVRAQTEAMLKGLYEVVQRRYLSTLKPDEMELLICGISDIDVDDWEANTDYRGGYNAHSPTVRLFWSYVRTLNPDQLTALLQFATGSPRLPPGGFAFLKATGADLKKFTLILDGRAGQARLPSAHTCFNELELPAYASWHEMERAISFAIAETDGFGLQ